VAERIAAEGLKVSALAVEGEPVEAILRIAETEHPDLIVVGSHSEGAGVALLDTVAERVVRRSSVSVLVVA
jgi:nucleotide-binding universal stress UspA family protein